MKVGGRMGMIRANLSNTHPRVLLASGGEGEGRLIPVYSPPGLELRAHVLAVTTTLNRIREIL